MIHWLSLALLSCMRAEFYDELRLRNVWRWAFFTSLLTLLVVCACYRCFVACCHSGCFATVKVQASYWKLIHMLNNTVCYVFTILALMVNYIVVYCHPCMCVGPYDLSEILWRWASQKSCHIANGNAITTKPQVCRLKESNATFRVAAKPQFEESQQWQ